MNGILLVDKPKGWTSFDVVAKIRNILASYQLSVISNQSKMQITDNRLQTTPSPKVKVKVGHTGTLDPLATGLLVLVIGNYTKRAQEFSKLDKTYEVTMKLGATSTTGDAEGTITPTKSHKFGRSSQKMQKQNIEDVLEGFVGEIEQVPPAFSAIKVNGQRAYKLAREGKVVKLEPRKVKIYEIINIKLSFKNSLKSTIVNKSSNFAEVKFTTKVSSGTYIRSLVEDIGQKLGTGAYMSDLKRTGVGKFSLDNAMSTKDLSAEHINQALLTYTE